MRKFVFFAAILVVTSRFSSPSMALALGILFGCIFEHPYPNHSRKLAHILLQASVVGLGFGMNLTQILAAGRAGFLYTALSISAALLIGWALGKLFHVGKKLSYLISVGTAICGGSAIAAVAPLCGAAESEIAIALGIIFTLNALALFLFPPLAAMLHLTQNQFGLWAALAIHDTSSVVGAGAKYGAIALSVAATVKLARALWIVPVSMATATASKSRARIQWPWFILFFCLAALANTYLVFFHAAYHILQQASLIGLSLTLFFIGTSITPKALRTVGLRPFLQAILLWILVAGGSLLLISAGWIHI